ncbi:MAG: glycosyltransferase family 39 protein [Bacteroidetes bacterium]|nr:glycosyltransferase family 39 protein [Bacteroidota bacterium]
MQLLRYPFIFKAIIFYAAVQIILLFFVNLPFTSDSLVYYKQASDCIAFNTFYPGPHNINDSFITAPVYINFLIIILRIFHDPLMIRIANIILNLVQLVLIYNITQFLFHDERKSKTAAFLYMIFLTNLGAIFYNYSELLFNVLLLLAFLLYLKDTKISTFISGLTLGLAVNTRPVGIAFLISIIIISIIILKREKRIAYGTVRILVIFLLTLIIIGTLIKINTGYFVPLPTNGACNMLMGANDDATGAYNDRVFQPGKAGNFYSQDTLTFREKEKYCQDAALKWIVQHPLKWLALIPAKLFHLFGRDDWAIPALMNVGEWKIRSIINLLFDKYNSPDSFTGKSIIFKITFIFVFLVHHIYFYSLLGMMIYRFLYYRKHKLTEELKKTREIDLFIAIGTAITLCSVGAPRYQYSFLIFIIPAIAPMIDNILQLKFRRNQAG